MSDPKAEFAVRVIVHTAEADEIFSPDYLKQQIGDALDSVQIFEGVDYSLEVRRVHV